MSEGRETLTAVRERVRLLESVWAPCLAVVLLALLVPWFLRTLQLDLAPVAWGVFVYAVAHVSSASAIERLASTRGMLAAAQLLHVAGILALAALWHLAGGVDNPAVLVAFVLPVMAAGMALPRGRAILAALLSAAAVAGVALLESGELRWYLVQVGLPVRRLVELLPDSPAARPAPFPGVVRTPAALFVLLEVFTTVLLAAALLSEFLAAGLLRLRALPAASAGEEARSLPQAALRAARTPAVLVEAEGGEVVDASDSFAKRMLLHGESLRGRRLFDLVAFAEPDRIRELLRSGGGVVPFCAYTVGREARVARLSVDGVAHGGARYAQVGFEDLIELFYLQAAFDAVDEPLLVLGADERFRYANPAAQRLFGAIHFGMEARAALEPAPLEPGWWRDGAGGEGRLSIGGRAFRATRLLARAAGEAEPLTIVRLQAEGP